MCDCNCSARLDAIEARLAAQDEGVCETIRAAIPKIEASRDYMAQVIERNAAALARIQERVGRL